jgi:PKD repeat protein/DNA-directed RNA polymerase subunit RPC12/RpoP
LKIKGFGPIAQACAFVLVVLMAMPPFATSEPPGRASDPPDAVPPADITGVLPNDLVTLDGTNSTDDDLSTCTVLWTCLTDPTIVPTPSAEDDRNATFVATRQGTFEFQLYIKDADGQEDSAKMKVTVDTNLPPRANIDSPLTGSVFIEGDEISFDGSSSSDPEGRGIISYEWTSNISGRFSTQKTVAKALPDLGTHLITLNVTDPNGGYGLEQVTIRVRDPPAAPVAKASVIKSVFDKGEVIEFDASMTTDANKGDVLNFTWRTDIGAGRTIGYGKVIEAVLEEGVHNVTLNVTDLDGLSDEDTVKVTVENQPPTARIDGPNVVNVSESASFSAFGSSDPDSDTLSFIWDFGDGWTAVGVNVTHAWDEWGSYQVNLTVDDGSDADSASVDTFTLKVNSIPVAGINVEGTIMVGESFVFRANCTDEDEDGLTYRWDFDDDGQFDSQGLTASHTFEEEGAYLITLEVSDGHAIASIQISVEAVFPNEVPIADAGRDLVAALIDGRGEVTLDGSGSYDPDDDPDMNGIIEGRERDNLTYSWDFDVTIDSDRDGVADNDIDAKGKTVRYVIKEEGPFTVALNVTDRRGLWARDTLEVRGDNPPTISSLTSSPSERALAGASVTFTASVRDADRSDSPTVTWEIEGTSKTGTKVTHVFTTSGMKEVVATVTDGFLNTSSTIEISIERLPAPKITTPSNGSEVSGIVKIRGTAVPAAGGIIKTVEISINDGPYLKCSKGTPDWKSWYYEWDTAEGVSGMNVIKVRVGVDSGSTTVYSTSQLTLVKASGGGGGGISMMILVPSVLIGVAFIAIVVFLFLRSRGKGDIELPPNGGQFEPGPLTPTPMAGPAMPQMPMQQAVVPGPAAPAPPQPKEKTIRIKCPACGGMFAYRDTGERPIHLVCDHCGAKGVIDASTTEGPGTPAKEGKAPPAKNLAIICPGCSGLFEVSSRVDSLKCPFCGAEGDVDESTAKEMDELFGPVPNMVTLRCPKCSETFEIKEGDREVTCPHCGVRGKI